MDGTWNPLTHQPPGAVSTMLLLTDGTVLAIEPDPGKRVWRLSPDENGSYVDGTWTQLASMKNSRKFFASAVLADGRVIVAGGEYSDAGGETNACEVYNPILNSWSSVTPPTGWPELGDAAHCMLPDGRLLVGNLDTPETCAFDPATDSFVPCAEKDDRSSEETWTLLPDETVLTVECTGHPKAEKYLIAADKWVSAGTLPVELVQASSSEIGPAVLLPDGRVFAIGATGNTALYTAPAVANQPGTWEAGPTFPSDANGNLLEAKDAPACLLPNGNVLCTVGPAGEGLDYPAGTRFFEFDGTSLTEVSKPVPDTNWPPFVGRMLIVPTGEVLYSTQSATVYAYSPDGAPDEDWRPEITAYPANVRQKQSHMLHGRLINGVSQACSYGDDAGMATNYPIVRIEKGNKHYYCRTFDHSTMGVATGLSIQSTHFKVPWNCPTGPAHLRVIANGIASEPVEIHVGTYKPQFGIDAKAVNHLIGSLADGDLWVLGPDGPHPVDPWGPDVARRAKAAWEDLFAAVQKLRDLGDEVDDLQRRVKGVDTEEHRLVRSNAERKARVHATR